MVIGNYNDDDDDDDGNYDDDADDDGDGDWKPFSGQFASLCCKPPAWWHILPFHDQGSLSKFCYMKVIQIVISIIILSWSDQHDDTSSPFTINMIQIVVVIIVIILLVAGPSSSSS